MALGALETPEYLTSKIDELGGPDVIQPLCSRLGPRDGHALPVDQAGRVALGRHAQRHDRALAEPHQRQGREPRPVPPRHRRRADDPRSGRPAAAGRRRRSACRRRSKASACSTRSTTPKRPDQHETQYFEMFGNRGIYHCGWTAVTRHKTPWLLVGAKMPAFDDDVWELYDTNKDWTPGQGHRQGDSREAARTSAPVADRSGQVQRPPAR